MSRRMTTRLVEAVEESIERHRVGEDITFDLTFGMTPQGPVHQFAFYMPSGVLGQYVMSTGGLQMVGEIDSDVVDKFTRAQIEELRTARSRALAAEGNGKPEGAPEGSQGTGPGGLHLPGG